MRADFDVRLIRLFGVQNGEQDRVDAVKSLVDAIVQVRTCVVRGLPVRSSAEAQALQQVRGV